MDSTYRHALLAIARAEMTQRLGGLIETPSSASGVAWPAETVGGLFVSLHRETRLRGCVGRLRVGEGSLPELTRQMAAGVLDDPRFQSHPVTLQELPRLTIEISVLSEMRRTQNPMELQAGVHGVYIVSGHQSGCFLPQVACHMGWSSEQLLSHCCSDKAGLPPDAWRDPETQVYLFTAEVFDETSA